VTPLQEFLAISGFILAALGFVFAYLRPGWLDRRRAWQNMNRVIIGEPAVPEQGLKERHGIGKRMADVEQAQANIERGVAEIKAQLQNNGGNSIRDVLDKIHDVAIENQEANARAEESNARLEEGQREAAAKAGEAVAKAEEAARLAGETGMVASRTEQQVQELAAKSDERHEENTARLDALESNDEDARIQRELLLMVLRDKHGIDLIDDEDDDAED